MLETILSLDYEAIIAAITTLAAAFAGILAGIKNKEAKKQEQTANAYAELAEQTEREKQEVIDFFDPENAEVQTPPVSVPERSWKMSEAVKGFLLAGHDEAEKVEILKQVEEAEAKKLCEYTISYEHGYYKILNGQINRHTVWGK